MTRSFTPDINSTVGAGLTRQVAVFAVITTYDDLPAAVIALGKKSILDGFGLALAGAASTSAKITDQYLRRLGVSGAATLIGRNATTAPRFAAFANGVAIHADDYDDTQLAVAPDRVYGLLTHPTAPALPPALAEAETAATATSGRDFMLAYHIGVEIECKIAEAISPRHYQHGFHTTGTCGTFAAAAVVGKLRKFDVAVLSRALALAGSQSAGLRENFGTMAKPFHAGRACESGVLAADLAEAGWTATDKILESPRGFFQAHGGDYDLSAIDGKLGAPWVFESPGVSIKPHPSGSLTHPGMTTMLELIEAHDIAPDAVQEVKVGANHNMLNALIHHEPRDELQAKFSMEFCMAVLLCRRRGGLPEFADDVVNAEDVRAMTRRVRFSAHPDAEAVGYAKMTTLIEIILKDGQRIRGQSDFGHGSPAHPMSYDEVADKFRGCADFAGFAAARADEVVAAVADLENIADMRELGAMLK